MEQGSNAWLEWRRQGIGSSDAPIIMGVSPYTTRRELYEIKVGERVQPENEYITQKGHRLEPIARAHYELISGKDFPPKIGIHAAYPFLRASFDGWNDEENTGLEIKFVGAQDFEDAKAGKVPERYYPQVQHQLLVSGGRKVVYFAFNGKEGAAVDVYPDIEYIKCLFGELVYFWRLIESRTPPEEIARDYKVARVSGLKNLLVEWHDLEQRMHRLKVAADKIKTEIFANEFNHDKIRVGNFWMNAKEKSITVKEDPNETM